MQTKEYLLDYIRNNKTGSRKLPSENELSRQLEISRPTIRLALTALTEEGVIEKVQGKGTFISENKTELNFVNWQATEEATSNSLQHILDGFIKKSPEVAVRNTGYIFKNILQQLIINTGSGTAPDIMSLVYFWIPRLAEQGTLYPLNKVYTTDFRNRLYSQSIDAIKYKDNFYALNWANGPSVFYYNKKIIKEITGSPDIEIEYFDELLDLFDKINVQYSGTVFPFCLPLNDDDLFFMYTIYSFLLSFKGGITDISGDIILNSENTIKAFTWLKKFISRGKVIIDIDTVKARHEFAHNRLAFFIDGPWFKSIVPSLNKNEPIDIGFQTLPKSEYGLSYSALANHVLAVSNQCKNKELALELIKYVAMDPKVSEYYYLKSNMFPASREEAITNPVYDDPFGRVLKKQMETAFPIPDAHPAFSYSISICAKVCREILLGHNNTATLLNNAAEAVKEIYRVRF
jgi:maltose-binding protein MalE